MVRNLRGCSESMFHKVCVHYSVPIEGLGRRSCCPQHTELFSFAIQRCLNEVGLLRVASCFPLQILIKIKWHVRKITDQTK